MAIQLRGLVLLPLIAKLLGASDYGLWVQAGTSLSLLASFCGIGSFAFIRFFAAETDKEKIRHGFFSILLTVFGLSSLVALVVFFLATPIARAIFGGTDSTIIVQLSALILPFFTINFLFLFFFRAFRRMHLFALLSLVHGFGEIALITISILTGWGIAGALVATLVSYLLVQFAMLLLIVKQVGISLPPLTSFAKMKDYLRFDLPFVPSNFSWWIASASDRYIIAIFIGVAATGVYAAAYGLASVISIYSSALNLVLVPTLAHLYDNKKVEDVKNHLSYSLKYYLLLAIPSVVGISLLANPTLRILATPEFAAGGSAVVPVLATAVMLHGCYGVFCQPLSLVKKTGVIGVAWSIAAALNLALNILFIPRWGLMAAAVSTLLSFSVAIGIASYLAFRYINFHIEWSFIIKSLLASAVMSVAILWLNPVAWLDVIFAIAIGALIYLVIIYLTRGISRQELGFLRTSLMSMFNKGNEA